MVWAEESITIDASCDAVFAVLGDLERMPQWRGNVESAIWTGQPGVGPGRIRAVTRLMGQRFTWNCDVTSHDPPNTFGYVARNADRGFEVAVEFRCEPEGTRSQVVMRGGGEVPGGRIGAVAAPLYIKALERENRLSLRKLKRLVEGGASA